MSVPVDPHVSYKRFQHFRYFVPFRGKQKLPRYWRYDCTFKRLEAFPLRKGDASYTVPCDLESAVEAFHAKEVTSEQLGDFIIWVNLFSFDAAKEMLFQLLKESSPV